MNGNEFNRFARLHAPPQQVSKNDMTQKTSRTAGPVFSYVKTDKNANFKWGVRHFVGRKYS